MIRRRLIALVSAVLVSLGVAAVTASPATALEVDFAVDVSWSENHDKECLGPLDAASACVQPYGDIIWVKDNAKGGHRVWVTWYEYVSERSGSCVNTLGVDAGWTWCNKDFGEGHLIRWQINYYDEDGDVKTTGNMYTYA